jgi:excisionase family DNA binding protein
VLAIKEAAMRGLEPAARAEGACEPGSARLAAAAAELGTPSRPNGPEVLAGGDPLFFSVAAAADTLAVSDDTVYELLHRGELPCLRIGRRCVIPRRAVELVVDHLLADFDPAELAVRLTRRGA